MDILLTALLYVLGSVLDVVAPLPPCEPRTVDGIEWGCWKSRASVSINYDGSSLDGPPVKWCLIVDGWQGCAPLSTESP